MTEGARQPVEPAPSAPAPPAGRRRPLRRIGVLGVVALLLAVAGAVAVGRWWPQEDYAVSCLAVGAQVLDPDHPADPTGTAAFLGARDQLGPLTIRRSFDPALPEHFDHSAATDDPAAGLRSFVSWKPPNRDYRGAARGRYDDRVTAWARSVPRTGVYATAFHEPENDMTAEQFVALQRHLYAVVKAANPTIRWGPIYMAYWWDPAQPSHYVGDPAAWWPGDDAADFAGLDWYGPDPEPMTTSPEFEHWYQTMSATGKPLLITEYGQYARKPWDRPDPVKQRERAAAIRADAAWIGRHPEFRMWMYWNGTGNQGDWRLTDRASQQAWRAVARAGCAG
jgi:hypothetical protein